MPTKTINTCLSPISYKNKPTSLDAGLISSSIASYPKELSFCQLVSAIKKGQTFTTACKFKGSQRKSSAWQNSQIFAADIDEGNLQLSQLTKKLIGFDIPLSIAYESFSSTEDNKKWRLLFISLNPVDKPEIALAILRKIKNYFGSDPAIVDLSRIFYGTTNLKVKLAQESYFDPSTINLSTYFSPINNNNSTFEYYKLPLENKKLNLRDKERVTYALQSLKSKQTSRYMSIFNCACKMAAIGKLSKDTIVNKILFTVLRTPRFNDYDRTEYEIKNIIINSINWKTKQNDF
jgi:hypothetical protein